MSLVRRLQRRAGLLLVPCLLVLPACLKAKGDAALTKDGSGRITERITFDQTALHQFLEMAALQAEMQGGGGGGGQQEAMTRRIEEAMNLEAIKKVYTDKPGVELLFVSRSDDLVEKSVTVETKVKFTSLDKYLRVGAGMVGFAADIRLEEKPAGTWTFTRRVWANLPGGILINDEMPEEMASQLDGMKMLMESMLGGLEIVLNLEVPGKILETNGKKNDAGTSVAWTFGFADLTDVKKMKQTVSFQGEGLALEPFHIRVGLDGRVRDVPAEATTTPASAPDAPKEPAAPEAPKAPETPKEPASPAAPK